MAPSALLGPRRGELLAAADLGYFRGYWSRWIAEEMVRISTAIVIKQAELEGADKQELKRRLERSSELITAYWDYCSQVLAMVDVSDEELPGPASVWSEADRRTLGTSLALGGPSVLVTDRPEAYSLAEVVRQVQIVASGDFLEGLYRTHSDARGKVAEYLARNHLGGPRSGPRLGIVPSSRGRRPSRRKRDTFDSTT